jgi:hypothetical protein
MEAINLLPLLGTEPLSFISQPADISIELHPLLRGDVNIKTYLINEVKKMT